MESSNNSTKIIGALILGAAVGAVLGILLAPEKGSILRAKIADNAKDIADNVQNRIKEEAENLRTKAADLERSMVNQLKSNSAMHNINEKVEG